MSTLIRSAFTKYEFTAEEVISASLLHEEQKRWYQTQLAILAERRINIIPDANNYISYIQEEAEVKGQMNALQYLLDCCDSAEKEVLELAKENNSSHL